MGGIQDSATIRDFCKHPGFKLYESKLQDLINAKKDSWLKGTDQDARDARLVAKGLQESLDILKRFIMQGDANIKALEDLNDLVNPNI